MSDEFLKEVATTTAEFFACRGNSEQGSHIPTRPFLRRLGTLAPSVMPSIHSCNSSPTVLRSGERLTPITLDNS